MSEKMASVVLPGELMDIMRSAVINQCGQLQDHVRDLRRWQGTAECAGNTEQQEKYEAAIKDVLMQTGLREIYRIIETARLGGTENTEEEDMIRMEASKPALSREDYRDIYKHLTIARETYLKTVKDAVNQQSYTARFYTNRANCVTALLDKVAQEAGLTNLEPQIRN